MMFQDKNLLFFAAQHNLVSLLHEIIKRGFSTMELDADGNNIVLLAYKNKHFDSVRQLIQELNLVPVITMPNQVTNEV